LSEDGSGLREPIGKPDFEGFGCWEGVRVGQGGSQVQADFWATMASNLGVVPIEI
jgi:hypothetical protein